ALGVPASEVAAALSAALVVPGRLEPVVQGQPFTVWVDYAHTPGALAEVLDTARREARGARVLVVFGCGGERDAGKRPVMGAVAAARADVAVLTSDNPRSEDPAAIIEQVRAGARGPAELVVEPDREAAIAMAVEAARPGDVVVVAGKGHERHQEIGGAALPFDDRAVVAEALRRHGGAR
ncbi:MAG: glutamate ligase domain-containing protein, partial [Acidimicrobiales bacterium]